MKVWITKYSLSKGIFSVEAEKTSMPTMISYQRPGEYRQYAHDRDWHQTLENAISRAEKMRKSKIEAHKKAIRKLEGLQFRDTCCHD